MFRTIANNRGSLPLKTFKRFKNYRVRQHAARVDKKSASFFALEHFDFFYKPIFGKLWPSIRLGLLSDQKYCAIINNYSNAEENSQILKDRGATDIIVDLLEAKSRNQAKLGLKVGSTAFESPFLPDEEHPEHLSGGTDVSQEETTHLWEEGYDEFVPAGERLSDYSLERMGYDAKEGSDSIAAAVSQFGEVPIKVIPDEPLYPEKLQVLAFPSGDISTFPQAALSYQDVLGWYLMDAASILPVLALGVRSGDTVLDLCAAPGGKTLILLQTLLPGAIVSNDKKMSRVSRMRRMLTSYVPESADIRERVFIKQKNAASHQWDEFNKYDKVLVDVPCTTDRHSLSGGGYDRDSIFNKSRSKERLELPGLQTDLLKNGLRSVVPGGTVVYSTCALSPMQNEEVVQTAISEAKLNYGIDCAIVDLQEMVMDFSRLRTFRFYRKCRYGTLVLPYLLNNFGPMYICKIKRIE